MTVNMAEKERLEALFHLNLLDSPEERDFNDIVELASQICKTPISLITLLDDNRQWFKAKKGLEVTETPRDVAFCSHVLENRKPLIVRDATTDPRFFDNPLVVGDPNIKFYAGLPISTEEGHILGTLCVIDREERVLSNEQMNALQLLRNQVNMLIKLRTKVSDLDNINKTLVEHQVQLQLSQVQLSAFFNATNESVCLIGHFNKILFFNKVYKDTVKSIFGKDVSIGDDVLQYADEATKDTFIQNVEKAFKGELIQKELPIGFGGAPIWWSITYIPLRKENSDEIFAVSFVAKNINSEKSALLELQERENRLRLIADNLPQSAVYRLKLLNDYEARMLYISSGIEQILGYSSDEIVGMGDNYKLSIYEEDFQLYAQKFNESKVNNTVFEHEFRLIHKNGSIIWVHARSQPHTLDDGTFVWDGVLTNINEKKEAERVITEKEHVLTNIFELSPVPMMLSKLFDGSIIQVNKSLENLSGYHRSELIGEKTLKFYQDSTDRNLLLNEINEKGFAKNLNVPIIGKKGILIDCLASVELVEIDGEKMLLSGFTDMRAVRKAEKKLLQSEQTFKDLTQNVPGVVYQLRVKSDGTSYFEYISEKAFEIFKIKADTGSKEWNLGEQIPQEDKEVFLASVYSAIQNKTNWEYEGRIICGDGSLKWFRGASIPVIEGDDLIFNGLMLDITTQKETEQNLKIQVQALSKHADQVPGVIYQYQLFPDGKSRFVYASKHIWDIYEVRPSEVIDDASKVFTRIHPDDYQKVVSSIQTSVETLNNWICEYRVILPQKGLRWLSGIAKPERLLDGSTLWHGYIIDITERKALDEALQQTQNNLQTIFANTKVGYILLDKDFTIVSLNNSSVEFSIHKFGKELLVGEKLINYFPEDRKEEVLATFNRLSSGVSIEYDRNLVVTADNQELWYHIKYAPVIDANNQVNSFVLSFENITERKKNEIDLQRSFQLVSEQNKRLLNFSYIVSHNLRSHTSNIKSIVNLVDLLDTQEEKDDLLKHLKQVTNSLDETLHHLNEVVAIQNNVNVFIDNLNLKQYINKACMILKEQISAKNAIINISIPDDLTVKYNPAYLESLMLNFMSNAIKYSHPNRQPIIKYDWFPGKIANSGTLIIADNGKGIDLKRHGDKLFGMYKTFHGNTDARGIGLFICKNQIDAMGGNITVESEPFVGTTFKIFFK